jgi:zinc protease
MRKLLIGALVLAAVPVALADDRGGAATDPKIAFDRFKLPNGLEVILSPDPSVPLVAVNVWYHVGSGNEVTGRTGFAHLFEHMMFQGTQHTGDDQHFKILRKIGSEQINGTTNADRTNYFEVVPGNQLETALWLESERMGYLLDNLTKASLDNQIDVVRNERLQNYDNRPYGKAGFAESEALYPEGHPYRHLTIGKHEDLVKASVDDVKSFFKTWYVPSNATIAIVGDFDPAVTKQLVTKWFGGFPTSPQPHVVPVAAPVVAAAEVTVHDDFAKLRQLRFAWHSPARYAPGDAELDIAANALDAEGPGRLYQALVYDRQLAQSVRAGQDGSSFSGIFGITVDLKPDADLAEIKKIVLDTVAQITRDALTPKELARVVAGREARAIYQLETPFGRSQTLQQYDHYVGDPDKITWDLDRFRHATPDAIRATIAKYLSPDHVITVITIPEGHPHEDNGNGPPRHHRGGGKP